MNTGEWQMVGLKCCASFSYLQQCCWRFKSATVDVGRDSSVGIATRYGLDGPGIKSRWERNSLLSSRPALGPTDPPMQ